MDPKKDNEIVDYISRIVDYDGWMLNPVVFRELDSEWIPHTIDIFVITKPTGVLILITGDWKPLIQVRA